MEQACPRYRTSLVVERRNVKRGPNAACVAASTLRPMGARPAGFTALVEKKRSSEALPILNIGTVARPTRLDNVEWRE